MKKEGGLTLSRHVSKHSVRSHAGMGGCWAKGYYNSSPSPPPPLRSKKSDNSPPGLTPTPPIKLKTTPPPAPKQKSSWNDSFAKSFDPHSSRSTIIPTTLKRVASHLDSFGLETTSRTFLVTHSITGGTGSGLTSRFLESLRSDHPKSNIISYTIEPFMTSVAGKGGGMEKFITDSTGPLYSYNTLLALVHLREYCDAVILKGNGDLLKTVLPTVGVKTATMSDINDRVALDIAGLTHPVLPHDSSVDMDVDVGLITSSVVEVALKEFLGRILK
ncbi:hypothetical protein TrVE_jg14299 [Triparma verrucosa]|uniref:Tubulin/FtsZ GTPase domain-containing protein n=2 Tax=Triparma TaxID=722752 RepID=A0A9W6ZRT9_9STRA|nr:hypothetical protein TrST_g4531 [Triparma strigata]GMI00054.1 hypothetical protein TrVE_jg14299 [Triparma verrucosa]